MEQDDGTIFNSFFDVNDFSTSVDLNLPEIDNNRLFEDLKFANPNYPNSSPDSSSSTSSLNSPSNFSSEFLSEDFETSFHDSIPFDPDSVLSFEPSSKSIGIKLELDNSSENSSDQMKKKRIRKRPRKEKEEFQPTSVTLPREQLLHLSSKELEDYASGIASARPLTSEEEKDIKRQRRLIKNRESAQASRTRRKSHMTDLEQHIQKLADEKKELRERVIHFETENKNLKQEVIQLQNELGRYKRMSGLWDSLTFNKKDTTNPSVSTAGVCLLIVLFTFGLFFQSSVNNNHTGDQVGTVFSTDEKDQSHSSFNLIQSIKPSGIQNLESVASFQSQESMPKTSRRLLQIEEVHEKDTDDPNTPNPPHLSSAVDDDSNNSDVGSRNNEPQTFFVHSDFSNHTSQGLAHDTNPPSIKSLSYSPPPSSKDQAKILERFKKRKFMSDDFHNTPSKDEQPSDSILASLNRRNLEDWFETASVNNSLIDSSLVETDIGQLTQEIDSTALFVSFMIPPKVLRQILNCNSSVFLSCSLPFLNQMR